MRSRPLLGLAVLVGCGVAALQPASTASSSVSSSTAVYRDTAVSGAVMVRLKYSVTAGTITAAEPRLQAVGLLDKTVTAQFGSDTEVTCTAGLLTVLNVLTGLGEASYTCLGLSEPAARPRTLRITAS